MCIGQEKPLNLVDNFMCQLDWATECPDIWLNIISGCVCEDASRRGQHWNWWPDYSRWPSPTWVGILQCAEGLVEQQGGGRLNSYWIHPLTTWTGILLSCSWCSVVLRPWDLGWKLHHQLSSSQALGLHHQISWFSSWHAADHRNFPSP